MVAAAAVAALLATGASAGGHRHDVDRDVRELPDLPAHAVEQRIAAHAMRFIRDGATLQTGIGGIPNQSARLLADGPGGDYGIPSEMFTDAL